MRRSLFLLAAALAAPLCQANDAAGQSAAAVHTLTLPNEMPYLPDGPGRAAFVGNCLACHSPNYVLNQPRFPRATWTAEVNKMIKVYGAPIAPDMVKPIVDYLVHFNGQEAGQP